jgi:hypothetical protein
MKYLIVLIFLLLLATPLLSHAQDKPLCEQYVCVAQFNWGYQFGGGGGSVPSVPDGDIMAYSDADVMVYSDGDKMAY